MSTANGQDDGSRRAIAGFFEVYADALVSGDLPRIALCYGYPGLVLADEGTVVVADPSDVEAAFAGAAEVYRTRGLVRARPTVERIEAIDRGVIQVDVRWDYLDTDDVAREWEAYRYVLRCLDGACAIHVVISRAAT
jgi:hypothetical protein